MSARYVVRILLGKLRMGIGDATVLDALAKVRWNDVKKRKLLEGAYHKVSDLGIIARTLWEHSEEEEAQRVIAAIDIQVDKPVHSQLAERLPTAEAIIAEMGSSRAVQIRWLARTDPQGWRTHHHLRRNLEDQSHMFPELIKGTRKQIQANR